MFKLILFLFGLFLSSLSLALSILYLNLLTIGYSFFDYVKFINRHFICIGIILGFLCIYISIRRKDKKNELFL